MRSGGRKLAPGRGQTPSRRSRAKTAKSRMRRSGGRSGSRSQIVRKRKAFLAGALTNKLQEGVTCGGPWQSRAARPGQPTAARPRLQHHQHHQRARGCGDAAAIPTSRRLPSPARLNGPRPESRRLRQSPHTRTPQVCYPHLRRVF